jgi:excisionase family DNA binding protein
MEGKRKQDCEALMTCDEVAEFLRVHVGSVRRWSRSGKLKAYKVGGRGDWRYRQQDVEAFLNSHGVPAVGNNAPIELNSPRELIGIR